MPGLSCPIFGTVLILALNGAAAPIMADGAIALPRVRSVHPTIARLITQAAQQSATFRHEIEILEHTDGLVYVHEAYCGHGVLACLVTSVESSGPFRLLNVKVDLRRSEAATMAAIGHELWHAIEALRDPHVTNSMRMLSFFQRVAPSATDECRFETAAAIRTGDDVLGEIIAYNKQGK